ncbi:MAG: hypothetical protein ACJ8BW_02405 [Ktedonobacteraceae bacterium]
MLFFPAHILAASTSFAWGLDRSDSQAIVASNHLVNHGDGSASMFGNVCRFSWLNQRIIDDEPALSTPRTWVQFQSRFEFFC